MSPGKRILVTDGETRAALAATRSLGRAGQTVYVSAPSPSSLAGTSRYCVGEFRQAGVAEGPRRLRQSLTDLVRELRPDFVLGVTDRALYALHQARETILPARLPPPGADAYAQASDKTRLFETCRRVGIRVPRGFVVPGGELPDRDSLRSLGGTFVVRPALSWRAGAGERWVHGSVTIERGLEGLQSRLREDPSLAFPYLVQERLVGHGCGLFVLGSRGRALSVFAHRRLREKPPWGGVSTLCESVSPPADLLGAVNGYLSALSWSGLAMFEFKRSEATGEAHLLEINARPWGSMALSAAAGVDFIRDLVSLARGDPPTTSASYKVGIRLRWWWGDVDHFYLQEIHKGRNKPGALAVGLCNAIRRGPWAEAWDSFQRDDPVPFGIETLGWLRR